MGMVEGADADRLDVAAGQFVVAAAMFEDIRSRLNGLLNQAADSGSSAQAYQRLGHGIMPVLTESHTATRRAATRLHQQAAKQRRRSAGQRRPVAITPRGEGRPVVPAPEPACAWHTP